jgi:catechol 2,3-dioxygenase-like lactoylglutathione lyase family enzyme
MFRADHAALAVKNLSRSRTFYEYLGARVVSRPSTRFVEVMLGNLRLHLVQAKTFDPPREDAVGIDHICVSVETFADLESVRDKLNASPLIAPFGPFHIQESPPLGPGQSHSEERPPVRTLYAKDPDGIGLEIRCYR